MRSRAVCLPRSCWRSMARSWAAEVSARSSCKRRILSSVFIMRWSLDPQGAHLATDYVAQHLDRVGSTQDEARSRFSGVPLLVTAAAQDHGRGRGGAAWINAPRAVAASLALPLTWPAEALPVVTLMAGLAARTALDRSLRLKWPNDVVSEAGAKVAGLLAERSGELLVIGLGANLYWPDPPPGMAGLWPEDPGPDAAPAAGDRWAQLLLESVRHGPDGWGRDEYRVNCTTIDADITWNGGGRGRAVDVDGSGGLVVETDRGLVTLRSGQVTEVRVATVDRKESR